MNKFKVGDKVVGNGGPYSITGKGWVGYVVRIVSDREIVVSAKKSSGCEYNVYAEYFDLVDEKLNFKLTEESVRDLLKCPKGYVIECYDLCYSPYTIKEDGVYDKDDDQIDFIEFLTDLHEYDYEIKKESDYAVEMTLAEVCEKLGKNIKIIKE